MGFFVFTPSNSLRQSNNRRLPEYIYQTATGLFIFRMKVPHDCRPYLNKKELQYSLRTRCAYSARKHIASILPLLKGTFEGIRQGIYSESSPADISHILKERVHRAIDAYPGRKRPAFRRENGHPSAGKTASVPIGMRPPFR